MIDIHIILLFLIYETAFILAGLGVMLFPSVPLQWAAKALSVVKCICRGIAVGFAFLWKVLVLMSEFVACLLVTGFFARSSLGVSVVVIGCGLIVACVGVPDEIDDLFHAIPEWRQEMEKYQETFYDHLIPMGDEDDEDDSYSGTSVYDEIMRYERLRKQALVLHEIVEVSEDVSVSIENENNDDDSLCYSIDSEWDGSILYGESIDEDENDDDDDDDGTQIVVVLDFHDEEEMEQILPTPSTIPDLAQDTMFVAQPSPRRSPRLAALAEARTEEQRLVAELQRAKKALGSTVIGGRRRSARVFQATK